MNDPHVSSPTTGARASHLHAIAPHDSAGQQSRCMSRAHHAARSSLAGLAGFVPLARIERFAELASCAGLGVFALLLGVGCSGESNSVVADEPGAGGTSATGSGGNGQSAGSGNPSSGNAGSGLGGSLPATTGGADGVGIGATSGIGSGGTDSAGGGSASEGCAARTSFVLGAHITVGVSWPGTLGTAAGSGEFNLWNLYRVTVDGNAITTSISPCGSELPPLTFSALVGGGQSLIEIPTSVWDITDFPRFAGTGSIAGFEPGSAFGTQPAVSLVGLTMGDPSAAWPNSYTDVTTTDPDADGNPGITAIPASGDGFTSPPVSIIGPRVDQVNIVSRTATQLSGTFSSCTELSGSATLELFDNHVVGCRTVEGDACSDTQTDFVDSNRTVYEVEEGGTFTARILDEAATCADVRNLP